MVKSWKTEWKRLFLFGNQGGFYSKMQLIASRRADETHLFLECFNSDMILFSAINLLESEFLPLFVYARRSIEDAVIEALGCNSIS